MSQPDSAPNADQAMYWNELGGRTWAEMADLLDRQIAGVSARTLEALAPQAGERLLDVGCGCGHTSLELAARVGPQGEVVGVDISSVLLDIARQRAAGVDNISFIEADAQTHPLEGASFDGLFSRFGVMFFADPKAAFRNLNAALKPGGRLAFVAWRGLMENPWMMRPLAAAARRVAPPAPPPPGAPGPFAFADRDRLRDILGCAGFNDITIQSVDTPIGGLSPEDALKLAMRVGPLGALLRENPEAAPKVVEDVRKVLEAHAQEGAVWMDGAVWIVTARKS